MAITVRVEVVSAEEELFSGLAEFVVAPGEMGDIGVYPRHSQLLTGLRPGSVRIKLPDQAEEILIYVSGGLLEVQPHVVTVLSDTAIRSGDLDEAMALQAKREAEELMQSHTSAMEYAHAQIELAQAVAQLQTIERLRKTRHG